MSRIIKYTNPSFPEKDWFKCTIGNITHSSPIRENVENWRDDRLKNHVYYKELAELTRSPAHLNKAAASVLLSNSVEAD